MPSKLMPAQQPSDAGEDLVRLAAAKDAEIAALTEQRDRAMAVVEAAREFIAKINSMPSIRLSIASQRMHDALAALDAEAAAESSPSLPETPE